MRLTGVMLFLVPVVTIVSYGKDLDDLVKGNAGFDVRSKWLSYGLVDNDDPIIQPGASLTFFDMITAGALFYIDVTNFGEYRGRGDRTWDFWEVDYTADMRHVFLHDDYSWLPTSVELGLGYRYEFYPPRTHYGDAQFWLLNMSLTDLWLVPCLVYERETMLDNGTYLNFSVSHEFELAENIQLVPVVEQGFGDRKRLGGYLQREDGHPFDRAGLMDFQISLGVIWSVLKWMQVSSYVAYTDFPFDRHVREAARRYRTESKDAVSWNFTYGIGVHANF